VHADIQAQEKIGAELYYYYKTTPAIQPLIHMQSANSWYAELRYNYEDAKTLSLYGGKTFSGGNYIQYTITPMAGLSTGRFTGVSLAFKGDLEWQDLFLSSQTQHSIAIRTNDSLAAKKNASNFSFSWSELGYNFSDHFFAGLAMQYSRQANENDFEPGLLAGLSFNSLSFPCYVFSPFRPGRYFVLGVNYEFNLKKKK
jgi:hypothetical protein